MKKIFLILFVLLFNSVYSQENKNFKDGYDFTCFGTEPFWDVKISDGKEISFDIMGNEIKFTTGVPVYTEISGDEFTYSASSDKYSIKVTAKKSECGDGMSDNIYPYTVSAVVVNKSSDKSTTFNGCGQFTFDYRLDDIWVLDKINEKQFSKDDFETRPYMELKIRDSRIYGNAGCNSFLGKIEIKGHKITFSKNMNLTKMSCDKMNLEQEFINALAGKTLEYKVDNGKLYLYEKNIPTLFFHHTD
jgi:heat shock protein HslJ/uncharacterized membrane protein